MSQPPVTQHFKLSVGHQSNCIIDLTKQGQLFCCSHIKFAFFDLYDLLMKFFGSSSNWQSNRVIFTVIHSLPLTKLDTWPAEFAYQTISSCSSILLVQMSVILSCLYPTVSLQSCSGCLGETGVCLFLCNNLNQGNPNLYGKVSQPGA
jgi:hypothetical protein